MHADREFEIVLAHGGESHVAAVGQADVAAVGPVDRQPTSSLITTRLIKATSCAPHIAKSFADIERDGPGAFEQSGSFFASSRASTAIMGRGDVDHRAFGLGCPSRS